MAAQLAAQHRLRPTALMLAVLALSAAMVLTTLSERQAEAATRVWGLDVSGHQGNVDWGSVVAQGADFAYVKATEGLGFRNPYFAQQYNGAYRQGLIRGAYHYARPARSNGAEQADYFIDHGGGWWPDGQTLPGALDIEHGPPGELCHGLSQGDMVRWIRSFLNEYKARTGRQAVIYTTTSWWRLCTGNDDSFDDTNPLWIPGYHGSVGDLPAGWSHHTFWQYSSTGPFPGGSDYFNGTHRALQAYAKGLP